MKKIIFLLVLFLSIMIGSSFGAEKKEQPTKAQAKAQSEAMPALKTNIVYGEIVSVDMANSAITLKNLNNSEQVTVDFNPTTGVTKITDASELKQGDNVRIIYQDQEGKKIARAIMFGKIRTNPSTLKSKETPKK